MRLEAIDHWPAGVRPVYFATPGAWAILQVLDRQALTMPQKLELLAGYSVRDIRGAYWLTRDRELLRQEGVLVDGEDAGRAACISARNALRRAFHQAQLLEEQAQLETDVAQVLTDIRGAPPARMGWRPRSPLQVIHLASAAQPLPVRLRLLISVRACDVAAGLAKLQSLASTSYLRGRWPSRDERPTMARVLALALQLQQELA